ncbi:unnamed protein product (macronuclear) [Paramecium tetraurelia]|uniref:RING-type domain-containing protein n=1 Tax=Paramecium tetraurelia TaxID=5888 RepID=A0CW58_PARTE|nr:uncharacterized protein GSPATT00001227001 [Paramecium tetraurelia]CAK75025.1 unnamed protein product [Paramecium tetraurelia]|eukprot:XP_001442422.1 hypothetical protein (macronuclear) [Paramecium tetraurelia strain d4-2]
MRRDLSTQQSQQTVENIPQIGTTFRFEQANQVLSSVLLSNSIYAIAVLLFSFQLSFDGNLLSVIYCIDSKLLLQLIHQLYFYRIFLHFNITEKHTLLRLISTLVEGSYLLVLNLYQISGTRDLLLLSNIFPLLNIFLSVILKLNEGNQYFKQSISQINLFHVFRNIALFIISIFLSLKLEGYFDIQWLYALWMFWILFGISASIVIYYIFVVLALGIQSVLEQNSRLKNLVIINFWILFFMISNTSMLLLIPISILNFHNLGNYGNIIDTSRIILIINQVVFSYFTVRFKPEMVFSLQSYLSLNDSVNPLNTLPTQQGEIQLQQFNNKDFGESRVSEPQVHIPKIVKRISKTYFGFEDLPTDKKSETQLSSKKPSHHKALSSQIQRCSDDQNEKIKLSSLINIKLSGRQRSIADLENNSQDIKQQVNVPSSISLSSINSCCICFENEPNALFMQCGHGGVCYNCAIDLWKNKEECYLCRSKIERVLQIKMSEQQKNIYQVVAATELNQKLKLEQKTYTQNLQQ